MRTRLLRMLAAVTVTGFALTALPSGPSSASTVVPDAMTLVERMATQPEVFLNNPVHEGPDAVVRGGLCTRLAAAGCRWMVATDQASVLVFTSAHVAAGYAGCGDDRATALGRMVVSFGNPARVAGPRQRAYVAAVRSFRRAHPELRNRPLEVVRAVRAQGLPMRNARFEDHRGVRPGRAAQIPGAVDMVSTDSVSVIVFAGRAAALAYTDGAADVTDRVGRVVLSYGKPPRVHVSQRPAYVRALRAAMQGAPATSWAAAVVSGHRGCGG